MCNVMEKQVQKNMGYVRMGKHEDEGIKEYTIQEDERVFCLRWKLRNTTKHYVELGRKIKSTN